ncbi:Hint domain-containing protein [Flammeovirga sp. SJP92]|uniref:Hint domain-containing protein n=1 Tax=Flammeovirga sp. SJP92 TaxID=1775430 RepID=UPI0015604B92|nr:Hint domain-containing protein [Flammeovirga sp. SJP92]
MTKDQKELFKYINKLLEEEDHLEFDFRDEKQFEFAKLMFFLSGHSKEYPGTLISLEKIKEKHQKRDSDYQKKAIKKEISGWETTFGIPVVDKQKDNTIVATGFGTVVGGFDAMDMTLLIQNTETKDIVAHGSGKSFWNTYLDINSDHSDSTDTGVESFMSYIYFPSTTGIKEENEGISGIVKRQTSSNMNFSEKQEINAPIRTSGNPLNDKAVNIGLGRPWSDQGRDAQFDYVWDEKTQNHPIGKVPFVGNATFSKNIKSPLVFGKNLLLKIDLTDKTSGGNTKLNAQEYDHIAESFSVDENNPKKLVWNLPPGVDAKDRGNPITFGNVPWSSDILAAFYAEIAVVLEDGHFGVTYVISTGYEDSTFNGTTRIMPINFVWHCLGKDALVTLEGNHQKVIEEIKAGDKVVINEKGDVVEVLWTTKGIHKSNAYKIITSKEKEIITSHNHIFFTQEESKTAQELLIGEKLKTIDGMEEISKIEQIEDAGIMCNLATSNFKSSHDVSVPSGTFFANGFLVGDVNAQHIQRQLRLNDINWIKSQVPSFLHEDVEIYFKKK